jgi:uroporphyrinogen-III decarboxylase
MTSFPSRFEAARQRIRDAYLHKDTGELPVVIMDVNYWLFGDEPALVPDDYFERDEAMFAFQMGKIQRHLERLQDDYVPLLFPWFGVGVVPSALGSRVVCEPKMDPAIAGFLITDPHAIKRLSPPDPLKDGLMPRVLRCIAYMRDHADLPVSFTDCQGPLNIALSLCGVQNLFLWMHDYPLLVHELMDFCTEVLIQWVKVQKQHAGQPVCSDAFPLGILLPGQFGGVWLSDDDCTVISPGLYKQFVVPYNSRVFKAFGGGALHFCGTAEHQLENFLQTDGMTAVHCCCLGNFRQVYRMQQAFENRLAIMVCDYTPLDLERYYAELLSQLKRKGTILAAYPASRVALHNGKYEIVSRDAAAVAAETERVIRRQLARHKTPARTSPALRNPTGARHPR